MSRTGKIVSILLVALILAGAAKHKGRQWRTGKLLDVEHSRIYVGQVGTARAFETYTIETADHVYVSEERIRWKWSKSAALTVNASVEFAIEKDHLYIRDENGKEHDTNIRKQILKEPHGN